MLRVQVSLSRHQALSMCVTVGVFCRALPTLVVLRVQSAPFFVSGPPALGHSVSRVRSLWYASESPLLILIYLYIILLACSNVMRDT